MCATVTRTACVGDRDHLPGHSSNHPHLPASARDGNSKLVTILTHADRGLVDQRGGTMLRWVLGAARVALLLQARVALLLGYRTCPGLTCQLHQLSTHVPAPPQIYITLE